MAVAARPSGQTAEGQAEEAQSFPMKDDSKEFLRYKAEQAHKFIRRLKKQADGYGSTFSEGVLVDCERFLKENPAPRASTHVVVTRRYLRRLIDCAKERLQLKLELKRRDQPTT